MYLYRMNGMNLEQQRLALQVIPPRSASNRDIAALETVMQGLTLGVRHPVALEIARTAKGRQFMLRATSPSALQHLTAQIQARYPQATIQPLPEDPLNIKPDEAITAVELQPGAASYLPLRSSAGTTRSSQPCACAHARGGPARAGAPLTHLVAGIPAQGGRTSPGA